MNTEILNNLLKQDYDFTESKFKSKVENVFVQIRLSTVTGRTEKIKHFVNDETYNKIVGIVESNNAKNIIKLYDELNVANIEIVNIEELENSFNIEVRVHSKALEYSIDKQTRKYISGDRYNRIDRYSKIVFNKIKDPKIFGAARKCPSCGANIDVNRDGQCMYCGSIFDLKNYDWIITYMDIA